MAKYEFFVLTTRQCDNTSKSETMFKYKIVVKWFNSNVDHQVAMVTVIIVYDIYFNDMEQIMHNYAYCCDNKMIYCHTYLLLRIINLSVKFSKP